MRKPKPLDLNTLPGASILGQLQEAKVETLHGPARHEWLVGYGWELVGIRSDGITRDYRLVSQRERLGYYIMNASKAIRFQVFLNLVGAGLICRGIRVDELDEYFRSRRLYDDRAD